MESFNFFLKSIVPLSEEEFENYGQFFKTITLPKNSYFAQIGKISHEAAFIKKGLLRTYHINEKSEKVTSCFCAENNLTASYKSFISQQPSELSIQSVEDTELITISYKDLQNLYKQSPLWQNIGRTIAERQYLVMEQYASVLCNETTKEKYLRMLKEQPAVIGKASVNDIASYLGITRRTLSRIRKEISQ
ncbi:Crp/Fnr family transcriptional regulator [Flavobacterium collinsii]|uniref:cAMP-binding proteins - catabolite gene activator and regulatory subunit of cAMP-dependent protein kinases n=1 Tax=Flavobacterium collinsii TaxID=1114861 RepID=A0A9W4TJG1_9FLAO|nr:Crp/Fnr family transcriptional regulator [Flavobacterium collinsii]CAI2768698.1 cAMP-binding proteins - catabolite gene activator and regulatory subunit of cAMP-dependent protein kinases [Flavobacterium collinsii]